MCVFSLVGLPPGLVDLTNLWLELPMQFF